MILSKRNAQYWQAKIIAGIVRWFSRVFPAPGQKQQFVPGGEWVADQTQHAPTLPLKQADTTDTTNAFGTSADVQSEPSEPVEQKPRSELVTSKQEIPAALGTPLEWFRGLPHDRSLVIYIDQPTTQIMEMLAMSRRQAADLFRVPMYAGTNTRWQTFGPFRMRRMDFTPAQIFQEQEDALGELENLLSTRWHSSTELSTLDQSILRAFEASCTLGGAPVIGLPAAPDAITQLRELLKSRAVMSEEANRIDGTLIAAFQKIGVALPDSLPAAG